MENEIRKIGNPTGKKQRGNGQGGVVKVPGSQNWYMIYRVNGKQHKATTGTTDYDDALRQLKEKIETLNVDGRRGVRPVEDYRNLRYEDIRDPYVETCKIEGASFIKRADGTEYLKGIPQLDEFFKKVRVADIDDNAIIQFMKHRMKTVSAATAGRELKPLGAMMRKAKLPNIPTFPTPPDNKVGKYIHPKEFAKILSHLPKNLQPFYTFLYATGCREGAARKITWSMVNEERDILKLPGTITKSGKPLTVVLRGVQLKPISKMLKGMSAKDDKPVFDSANYRTEWSRAVAKTGLGTFDPTTRQRTGVRIHDCRVSAATNAIRGGVAQVLVMEMGGWETDSVFKRYNITDETALSSVMEKVGDYVDAQMKG
jgi:integrase